MPVLRKRAAVESKGLYVHSSPPRVLSLSAAHVKHLIRNGDIDKLEQIVLEGQGKKLVGEYSADYKTRMFLKNVPALMSKIALLHDSVNSDRLSELQSILDEEPERKKKLVTAKDDSGVGLLHKAVYYDLKAIYRWILDKFPHTASMRDSEGRTPYFYTLLCKDPGSAQKLLIAAGADPSAVDYKQHSAKYYSKHLQELELPSGHKTAPTSRKSTASKESLNFKKSNIRIWIHQRNLANLQQVVWEGHGSKLLVEHSNNTRVKKFLEAVPFIMSVIKDVHCDVQNGDLGSLKNRTSPPVPINVLTAKDANGLTPLHKAVGLGKDDIVEYIISEIPSSVNVLDKDGRTPLHYAALLKDNHKMFKFLVDNGADESILDHRQKSAAYYNNRASEMDTKLLHVVPECPRGAKEPHGFDWTMLNSISPSLSNGLKKVAEKLDDGHNNAPAVEEEDTGKNEKDDSANDENNEEKQEAEDGAADKAEEPTEEQNVNEEAPTNAVETSEQSVEGESEQKEPEEPTDEANEKNQDNNQNDNEEEQTEETEEAPPEEENNPEECTEPPDGEETNQPDGDNDDESNENVEDNEPINGDVQNDEETNAGNEEPLEAEERPSSSRPSTRTKNRSRPETAHEITPEDENGDDNDGEGEKEEENEDEEKTNPDIEGEGVIEGVVNGEHEVEPMNNDGQNSRDDDDDDVKAVIDSGNMEQLAALVLNGEGDRLVGQKSDNQELQTFLDNVPVYMSKIRRIHMAAREGSLRDLQAALDRRKFAVARDSVSPNGATPLHVAVVFSRTSVVRYLAGRFPETVHVEDDNGRTPLHYAAVLKDNGHYYNLLLHLGADNRVKDKFGHNAEYYLKNQADFSHRQILTDFGAEDEADDILNDRVSEDIYSSRKDMDDEDMISVLERCYNVIHGRHISSSISSKTNSAISTTSSSTTVFTTLLSKHLKRYVFDSIRLRITKLDHNLYDVIWPSVKKLPSEPSIRSALDEDFPMGVVAPDYYTYRVFAELLEPMIKEYNYMDVRQEFSVPQETTDYKADEVGGMDLDPTGKWVVAEDVPDTVDENNQVDMPFFATEEGRYLASSLGDPLIKGLTEVANKRPSDPIAYLATYLYNFARSRDGSNNMDDNPDQREEDITESQVSTAQADRNEVPANIDVVTVEPEDGDDGHLNDASRDEHGQSMLHFAAARSHGRNALYQLLLETDINVAYRDELYRTARDISIQANIPVNTAEIDKYILYIATKGDTSKLVKLLLDGYDHITDIVDEQETPIVEVVSREKQIETVSFLQSILAFEEKRERVHHAIRQGSNADVMAMLADENDTGSGKLLAIGKNSYGRCSLHIAVLCQQEEIVDYLANTFTDTLRIGDNLERTALHYAMGVEKMETITRVLIKAGAKRVVKDLKGRQPTYYFLNKSDILRLQEEEETF